MKTLSDFRIPGIYAIHCDANGKSYIGQSRNIQKRWIAHRWHLNKGIHRNHHLQRAWTKYGPSAFRITIERSLSHLSSEELSDAMRLAEVEILSRYQNNFNLMTPGEPSLIASDETRQKLSEERLQRWSDPEYRGRVSESHRIKHQDPDFSERRNAAVRKGMATPEYRTRRTEILEARWAEGGDLRETQSEKRKESWQDPDYRKKQTTSRTAAWVDPTVRAKRIEAMKASWADPERAAVRRAAFRAKMAEKPTLKRLAIELLRGRAPGATTVHDLYTYATEKLSKESSLAVCGSTLSNLVRDGVAIKIDGAYIFRR